MATAPVVPKTLYRKYRPTKLSEVVGQTAVIDCLTAALKTRSFAHAYLFTGPRGTGKTSVARIFAHAVNDFPYAVEDHYLDIVELDAASHRGIENIRNLITKTLIAPTQGNYKVYIIDEIHMLSKDAFNALLKTLEEPPAHVIFILATTEATKIPLTIASRSQILRFALADSETLTKFLRKIARAEKLHFTDDALQLLAKCGGGSFRDALTLLDQVATFADSPITAATIYQAFGLPQAQLITELLQASLKANLEKITQLLKAAFAANLRPEALLAALIDQILDQPTPALLPLLQRLSAITPGFTEAKLLLALTAKPLPPPAPEAPAAAGTAAPVPAPSAPARGQSTAATAAPTLERLSNIMGDFQELTPDTYQPFTADPPTA